MGYLYFPVTANEATIVIWAALGPFMVLAFTASFYPNLAKMAHRSSAIANLLANLVVLYLEYRILGNPFLAAAMVITIIFFGFFVLRLRLNIAISVSMFHTVLYTVVTLQEKTQLEKSEVVILLCFVWMLEILCIMGGYFKEMFDRRLFIQKRTINEQQRQLSEEKQKSDTLLLNILPSPIADRLKTAPGIIADVHEHTSILFADIVDFTHWSTNRKPEQIVRTLNRIFSSFDELVEMNGLEKIKTIGDAYMVAAGVPKTRDDHAQAIARLAHQMMNNLRDLNEKYNQTFRMRIGIHSGPVVAGIIGSKKFHYDLWGDTVNTASRMESQGVESEIQVTEQAHELLKNDYQFEKRGMIDVKGKGQMMVYLMRLPVGD